MSDRAREALDGWRAWIRRRYAEALEAERAVRPDVKPGRYVTEWVNATLSRAEVDLLIWGFPAEEGMVFEVAES